MRSRLLFASMLVGSLLGCDSCETGGPVPFGLDAQVGPRGSFEHRDDPPPSTPTPDVRALSVPADARSIELDGAAITFADEIIHGGAALDLDADGDADALLVVSAPTRPARLLIASREPTAFAAPTELAQLPPPDAACERRVSRVTVARPQPALGLVSVELACAQREQHVVAFTVEARPRVRERFALRPASERERLDWSAEDRDGDGHADLLLRVTIAPPELATPATITLAWLDRPAGLAREPAEPEAEIARLANEARPRLRRDAERALESASRALAIRRALCREEGAPRLAVGSTDGLACGTSAGAGRTYAVLAQGFARTGRVVDALDAWAHLEHDASLRVRDADRDAARTAIEAATAGATVAVHEGPEARPLDTGGELRLSTLGFLDEDRLLVRGPDARIVHLGTGELAPATREQGDARILGPQRAVQLIAIERRCEGTVLVTAAPIDAGSGLTDRRTTLLDARSAPVGAPCPDLTPQLRADADRWVPLGWAPQGVVVARAEEVALVPFDAAGRPLGGSERPEPGVPLPAPLPPGHADADARAYVHAAPFGLVLVELGAERRTTVLRPEGFAPEGAPIDVAISPSLRRIAWIGGGRVRWIER